MEIAEDVPLAQVVITHLLRHGGRLRHRAQGPPEITLVGLGTGGLIAFRTEMGEAWRTTTVVIMTEFGRTARPNGTRGTDHGTAGAGFLLGPGVARSMVYTDWPELADRSLFEGRDLKPTLDTRSLLKAAIAGTFDVTASQLERVFPGASRAVAPSDVMKGV